MYSWLSAWYELSDSPPARIDHPEAVTERIIVFVMLKMGLNKIALLCLLCALMLVHANKRRHARCPGSCTCSKDNALCTDTGSIPRSFPPDVTSVSFVKSGFTEIPKESFIHTPALHLLVTCASLFTASVFESINEDAFLGLPHLEYLFIENNQIGWISPLAFRGLRALIHLSLANNNLETLPRELFRGLDALTRLDLRGNKLLCDCKLKWLLDWTSLRNASVDPIPCAGPPAFHGRMLNELMPQDFDCITTDFSLLEALEFQSISVESFSLGSGRFVVFAQPFLGRCSFMEWDHVQMEFRSFDNISSTSPVLCKPLEIQDQLFLVVAQLFGGSHIFRRDVSANRFLRIQDIDILKIRKPNDVEVFRMDDESFFIIADSSKAGSSTVYRWNGNGFYSVQSLHSWRRDTDAEFLEISGNPHLILSSSSQRPVLYQWDRGEQQFQRRGDLPEMEDVYAVKHFHSGEELYLCLTRFLGDSVLMRWDGAGFQVIQTLASRGSMVFKPFSVGAWQYAVLGSDFSFTRVFRWDDRKHELVPFQELSMQAPRAFALVPVDGRLFLIGSSFRGQTRIYEHLVLDLSS